MAFLCPVRIKKHKRKGVPPRQLEAPLPGRITGSDSIDTLVRVGLEKEQNHARARMVVVHDFVPCVDDELEVHRDQQVQVLYQENDWLYVITEEGKEGFIPYTYCLPVERSVDDFVLPKSKRAYLTQSRLTGGHVKSDLSSNLTRTNSKSMPDVTQIQQRQQPLGQSAHDQNRNMVRNENPQQSSSNTQQVQNSHQQRQPQQTHHHQQQPQQQQQQHRSRHDVARQPREDRQRSKSSDRHVADRSRDSTCSQDHMAATRIHSQQQQHHLQQQQRQQQQQHQRSMSQDRIHAARSRDSSRTRDPQSLSFEQAALSRSFSTSFNIQTGSDTSHPQQQQQPVHYKSAPTTPDWNRHRRGNGRESSPNNHDYYNLLPLDVAVAAAAMVQKSAPTVKNSALFNNSGNSSGYNPYSDGKPQPQQQNRINPQQSRSSASGSQSNLSYKRGHSNSSHSPHTSVSSHSPHTNHPPPQQHTSQHSLNKAQSVSGHEEYSNTQRNRDEKLSARKQDNNYSPRNQERMNSQNRSQAPQFVHNSPFYQPGQSTTLPRNFSTSPSKQAFLREHTSPPDVYKTEDNHQQKQQQYRRQNSLPAHYHHNNEKGQRNNLQQQRNNQPRLNNNPQINNHQQQQQQQQQHHHHQHMQRQNSLPAYHQHHHQHDNNNHTPYHNHETRGERNRTQKPSIHPHQHNQLSSKHNTMSDSRSINSLSSSHAKKNTTSSAATFEKRTYGQYIALYPYSPRQENDIGVERGEFVTLLNKDDEDWYWIRKDNGHEGFVPKSFLCPAEGQDDDTNSSSNGKTQSNNSQYKPSHQSNTYPRQSSSEAAPPTRPLSPAPTVSPPPVFNMEHATKLVCLYDYKASAPDDLSVTRRQWLYADLDRQPDPEWLWVYSEITRTTGYIPRTYAKPPNFGSVSNLRDPFVSP